MEEERKVQMKLMLLLVEITITESVFIEFVAEST